MVELAPGLALEVDDPALLEDPEVLDLLAKANESIEENPLFRYVPHERQRIFHEHRVKTKAFVGGNRSGKSTATVIDCLIQAIDLAAVPEELRAYRIWPEGTRFKCRFITPDYGKPFQSLLETIQMWVPPSQLKGGDWEKAYKDKDHIVLFANGSVFDFMTTEQPPSKHGGSARHRCVDDQTRVLGRDGWATIDSLVEGEEILTLDTASGRYEWQAVQSVYRGVEAKMTKLRSRNNFDLRVTPDHRWWVHNKKTKRNYFTTTEDLKTTEQLVVAGAAPDDPDNSDFSDAEVALTGWLVTDGWLGNSNMFISQSLSYNPEKCEEIEGWFQGEDYRVEDRPYREGEGVQRNFAIKGELRKKLEGIVGTDKNLPLDFVSSLGARQREILLDAVIKGDGMYFASGGWSLATIRDDHKDAFLWLATLCGRRVRAYATTREPSKDSRFEGGFIWNIVAKSGESERCRYDRVSVCELEMMNVYGVTRVWCPTVPNSTFVAERNGAVFVTGNCVWDEEPPDTEDGERVYTQARMRIADYHGDMLWGFTPISEKLGWVFDEIYEQAVEDGEAVSDRVWLNEAEGLLLVQASIYENPHLSEEGREDAIAGIRGDQKAAVTEGAFTNAKGLVYEEFDPQVGGIHVVPEEWIDRDLVKGLEHLDGIDPGQVETAILFTGVDKHGRVVVYDELTLSGRAAIPEHAAEAMATKREGWGLTPTCKYTIIDPAARSRDLGSGERVGEQWITAGVPVLYGKNDLEAGCTEIERRLVHHIDDGDGGRKLFPLIVISSRCVGLIRQLRRYRKKPKEDGSFGVVKKDDHKPDVLRYICMERRVPVKRKRRRARQQAWVPGTAPAYKPSPRRRGTVLGKFT